MKKSVLRAPLIKSAFIIIVFSFLVYFTSNSADGSIWSSVSFIVIGVFKVAQLAVGLILSLSLCLVVLGVIFFGTIAMISKDSAVNMYQDLFQTLRNNFYFLKVNKNNDKNLVVEIINTEINGILNSRLNEIKKNQAEQYLQIRSFMERVDKLEKYCDLADLENQIKVLEKQVEQLSPELIIGDVLQDIATLGDKNNQQDNNTRILEERLGSVNKEITELKAIVEKSYLQVNNETGAREVGEDQVQGEEKNSETLYRICSYLEDPADCEDLEKHVGETLGKEMTFAQVIEYVNEKLSNHAAQVINDHPSLMKDYIRKRRKGYEQ